jgi:tRNA (guanosine-2'-O-)-methyltransferase
MTPERAAKINKVLEKRQNDLTVIIENVTDPHNIAAVMRTCDAVGISELFVLNTKINNHKRFGTRSSSSAQKWMHTHQFTNMQECMSTVRKKYKRIYATHLGEESKSIYEMDFTGPIALVFGNEKRGVSDEIRALCDGNFIIPQVGMISSLNISVACAVTIYEAFRQKDEQGHYKNLKLTSSEKAALYEYWDVKENI